MNIEFSQVGATPGRASANALIKTSLQWSMPCPCEPCLNLLLILFTLRINDDLKKDANIKAANCYEIK
jgi:hypothetical protein